MKVEPVNPDDPQMTAYILGELSVAEAAEFEAQLRDSPMAQRDVDSMRDVMDLLRVGLGQEWQVECEPAGLRLLEPVPSLREEKVLPIRRGFHPVQRKLALAAAVAGMALIGSMLVKQSGDSNTDISLASMSSASGVKYMGDGSSVAQHVPQIFLADEIDDLSSLDFAKGTEGLTSTIDPSYLENDSIIPAGFRPGPSLSRTVPPEKGGKIDRVDSYLPSLAGYAAKKAYSANLIEHRLSPDSQEAKGTHSVFVRGYVTMDGGAEAAKPKLNGSFQPVSISGNPLVEEGSDSGVFMDLDELQKDLNRVLESVELGSKERATLESILERSKRVAAQVSTSRH